MLKIYIASDHAGFELKSQFMRDLPAVLPTCEFVDLGPTDEKSVDYPDYSKKLCQILLADKSVASGILICGSGQGMAMSANRHQGIRAALCWDLASAKLSRVHNNANVLCLGSRLIPYGYAKEIAKLWLTTAFEGGRHQGRLSKFDC